MIGPLVDFARFLQWPAVGPAEEPVPDADEKWDQLLARPEAQRVKIEMAREALADRRAGRTTALVVTEDGRLASA